MCFFQSEQESLLEEREQRCLLEAERLRSEREQLETQLLEYQQNVDRLREGQRSVEMEKERVEAQQRVLQSWRHNRQSSLPVTIPLDEYKVRKEGEKMRTADAPANGVVSTLQVPTHSRTGSLDGRCSLYTNQTVLAALNQNQLRQPANNNQQPFLPKKPLDGSLHSSSYTANVGLSASLYNSLNTLLSQAHNKQPPDALAYPNHTKSHGCSWPLHDSSGLAAPTQRAAMSKGTSECRSLTRSTQNIPVCGPMGWLGLIFVFPSPADFSPPLDRRSLDPWMSDVTGHGLYDDDYPSLSPSLAPLLPPQAYLSLEGQNGEEAGEENVVYL